MIMENKLSQKPSSAFMGASWLVLLVGVAAYIIGLFNATMALNEKGYYFTVLMFGLFGAISLQKTIRDQSEGMQITGVYYGLAWFSTILSIVLLVIGLWNAELLLSEKGFYGISFLMSLFASITVQKNIRDMQVFESLENTNQPF
jgi:uncharacterized membrane protein YiaA